MLEFIRVNFKCAMENYDEKVAPAGIVLMLLAAPTIAAGLGLFSLNWYCNRKVFAA